MLFKLEPLTRLLRRQYQTDKRVSIKQEMTQYFVRLAGLS